ncbi:MAG TPA: methionyl-tRNA formyltransferase [Acidimicrobiales bacterium]|nr:methionyl-tRNA formyltransferase [Acidimicrobiales bacterium]
MRLVFLGTPAAAVPSLRALVAAGHDVALVVSRADARRGRRGELAPSPVKAAAAELGIPCTDRVAGAVGCGADLGVVVAYGRLIKPDVLAALPMLNVHFSLLPRWRGAAPVERAVLAGDPTTGVCLMALEETLDTGPVYRRTEVAIDPTETVEALRGRLAHLGARLLVDALADGLGEPQPQHGEVTYAAKVTPDELELRWGRPAVDLARLTRLGRAHTTFRGRRLLVVHADVADTAEAGGADAGALGELRGAPPGTLAGDLLATGRGALRLVRVQPEGRRAQPAAEWRNGARPAPGEVLGRP